MTGLGRTSIAVNPVKADLAAGRTSLGSWLSLGSPEAAERLAHIGWDWLMVDVEHSLVGFESMTACFRAVQLGGAVPLARVPWNDTIWIQRTLDAGALGLVVPMINTPADAISALRNMRYATAGVRSWGSSRVAPYVTGDYRNWADENLLLIVQIETVEAVANVDAIMAIDGVDACLIGPNDLALSMGVGLGDVGPGTPHEDAIQKVLDACRRAGKAAGKHCGDVADASRRLREGFQFVVVRSDASFMESAARADLEVVRSSARRVWS